jgi:serine/threonine-protein kinase
MEFLDGHDLAALLERDGALSPRTAVSYVVQACEAVAEAHAVGVIHRDLKPANLVLTCTASGDARIKVVDFGISKVCKSAPLTHSCSILGSFGFMAPEQMVNARSVDARADIWSLGATLFELVTGKPAFPARNVHELLGMVHLGETPDASACARTVPPGLAAVIKRCLAKYPADRYATVAELARALVPFGPKGSRTLAERVTRALGEPAPRPQRGARGWRRAALLALPIALAAFVVAAAAVRSSRQVETGPVPVQGSVSAAR